MAKIPCDEIADKIEEQKIKKAKSKLLFTRQKNQLADLLEDGVASNCEIRTSSSRSNYAKKKKNLSSVPVVKKKWKLKL